MAYLKSLRNQGILVRADIIIPCEQGYQLVLSKASKTQKEERFVTLNLVPNDLTQILHQIMMPVGKNVSDKIILPYKYKHLEPVVSTCKDDKFTTEDLITKLKPVN